MCYMWTQNPNIKNTNYTIKKGVIESSRLFKRWNTNDRNTLKQTPTSLDVGEVKIEASLRFFLAQLEWLRSKNQTWTNVGMNVMKEHLFIVGGDANWCIHYRSHYGGSFKNLKLGIPFISRDPPLGYLPKGLCILLWIYLLIHAHCCSNHCSQETETD